ncbi:MAG: DUF362 domain-containing protein [Candidatus Omnitrophota bacterium]
MKKSVVFLARTADGDAESRQSALGKIIARAESMRSFLENEIVPIKITLGDSQCVYNISPALVKRIAAKVRECRAKPFLTDTNVIYKGERANAVDHLTLAQNKGFSHTKTGAPFIIADGMFGRDGITVKTSGRYISEVRVPSFVGALKSIVVISHITGHILSGYAGAIKNIAMGMACKPSKQVQHSSLKPSVLPGACTACGQCINGCPSAAISLKDSKAHVDRDLCIGCGECLSFCKFHAIKVNWDEDPAVFSKRMAEVAGAVLRHFTNVFSFNMAFDITKECDCISAKHEKIICPDIGILASNDILALDRATVDIINAKTDIFKEHGLNTVYGEMFSYSAETGLGTGEYTLEEL